MRILITSGPTRASLDAVRVLTNRSTGRFGTLLANEALRCGARVTMVYGLDSQTPIAHRHLRLIRVETNEDLEKVLKRELLKRRYDVVIHAMAVLDFVPKKVYCGKVPSRGGDWTLQLKPRKKIISKIKKWAPKVFLVGFKLEVGVSKGLLIRRGLGLLRESRADLVVANQLCAGGDDRHAGYLIDRQGKVVAKSRGKRSLSREIIRRVEWGERKQY